MMTDATLERLSHHEGHFSIPLNELAELYDLATTGGLVNLVERLGDYLQTACHDAGVVCVQDDDSPVHRYAVEIHADGRLWNDHWTQELPLRHLQRGDQIVIVTGDDENDEENDADPQAGARPVMRSYQVRVYRGGDSLGYAGALTLPLRGLHLGDQIEIAAIDESEADTWPDPSNDKEAL